MDVMIELTNFTYLVCNKNRFVDRTALNRVDLHTASIIHGVIRRPGFVNIFTVRGITQLPVITQLHLN